ncbi:MAG: FAD-dependent oxidoreductase [Candidatus Omnitrophica bacterium]|nr:FAD-dependent oxidoreductase [Candidatus Omnitrophota bacterium]
MDPSKQNVAVVGGGVAGIVAAYLLSRKHSVTLYEKNDYLGGHTNTVQLKRHGESSVPVDTGFIVFNEKTYPLFCRFLTELNVDSRQSDMSFSFFDQESGFHYSSDVPNGLFAQRSNLLSPRFYRMVSEILRFNKRARKDLVEGNLNGLTLGEYLNRLGLSELFVQSYVLAMGAAIWSCPTDQMRDFPAQVFVRFFENHGLLSVTQQPKWRTVVGGSQSYVRAFKESFRGQIHVGSAARAAKRQANKIQVLLADGARKEHDCLVMATHADEALELLSDPSEDEKRLLSNWEYSKNEVLLHTDISAMPPTRRAWTSWNYAQEDSGSEEGAVSVTYYMNRLQGIEGQDYFVSLNRRSPIASEKILKRIQYTHPVYTFESIASQDGIRRLNGQRNTYFCGSYLGYGFHEDAVSSAVDVARHFGEAL